jgi:hypothetical protein
MKLLNHRNHIDQLPPSPLKNHIIARRQSLIETDDDIPPIIIIVEEGDDITGPDFAFISETHGLLSDLYDEHNPGEEGFTSPFEWISYLPDLKIWEALYLEFDMGTYLIIPDEVANSSPELLLALNAQELSDPQPL